MVAYDWNVELLKKAAQKVWHYHDVEGMSVPAAKRATLRDMADDIAGRNEKTLRHAIETMPLRLIIPADVHFAPRDEPDWMLKEWDRIKPLGRFGTWWRHAWWRAFGELFW